MGSPDWLSRLKSTDLRGDSDFLSRWLSRLNPIYQFSCKKSKETTSDNWDRSYVCLQTLFHYNFCHLASLSCHSNWAKRRQALPIIISILLEPSNSPWNHFQMAEKHLGLLSNHNQVKSWGSLGLLVFLSPTKFESTWVDWLRLEGDSENLSRLTHYCPP